MTDLENNQGRKQVSHLFQKGVSGNPSGRPKGAKSRSTLLKEGMEADWLRFLQKEDPTQEEKISRWEALMQRVYEQAMSGDDKAMRLIVGEVHKDLRNMNAIQAKGDQGPRNVKINIQTKEPKEKVIQALVLEKGDDLG